MPKRKVNTARKLPEKNVNPRSERKVNPRQELFALEYCKDFDRVRAIKAAGYNCNSYSAAHEAACRLLKNPKVYSIVIAEKARIAERLKLNAEGTVRYLQLVVMEAIRDRDWRGAVMALREIGKHYGIYEKHNKQTKYTVDDIERLKTELTQAGFNFDWVNYKPSSN